MADIFNEQRVVGVRLVPDGTIIYNNQQVIGVVDAGAALFVNNIRTLGVDVLAADGAIHNEQPMLGAVLIKDGRTLYNGRLVVPVHAVSGVLGGGIGGNDGFTKLLLHMDGADASTVFTDASAAAHVVTPAGNAQIDTAQSVFGGASALFDGAGDYLLIDGGADFAFGAGDFTIDFRLRLGAIGLTVILYDGRPNAGVGFYPTLYILGTDNKLYYYTNAANRITSSAALAAGTWYHIALVRSAGNTMLFIDGVQTGATYVDANSYINDAASRPVIGIGGNDLVGGSVNGWIDELRVSKGVARWTANFAPPNAPYS